MPKLIQFTVALLGVAASACAATSDQGSPRVDQAVTSANLDCPTCAAEPLRFRYSNNESSVLVVNRTIVNRGPSDLSAEHTYAFSLEGEQVLPAGLHLDGATGVISGVATKPTPGQFYRIHAIAPSSHRIATLWFDVKIAPEGLPAGELAHQFFVSPSGDDANVGTFGAPFLTIKKALQGRVAGDTVNLRGGVYVGYQSFTSLGASGSPLTIRSYPGERAILEATSYRFAPTAPPAWRRAIDPPEQPDDYFDPKAHPDDYVSRRLPLPPLDAAGNETDWLNRAEFLDRLPYTRLLTYSNLNDLRSDEQTSDIIPKLGDAPGPGLPPETRQGPFYVTKMDCNNPDNRSKAECLRPRRTWTYFGPGVYWDRANGGRVHIRLSHTTNGVDGITDYAGETNPNNINIGISWAGTTTNGPSDPPLPTGPQPSLGFVVNACKNLVFEHLSFRYGGNETIRLTNSTNVTFDHLDVRATRLGLHTDANSGTRITHSHFSGGIPSWTFRSDYKEDYEIDPARSATSPCDAACVCGPTCSNSQVNRTHELLLHVGSDQGAEIAYNEFFNGHDAVYLGGIDTKFHHNSIDNVHDDAFYMNAEDTTANTHIYENVFRRNVSTFSFSGRREGGNRYIYRNLLDQRAPIAGTRPQGGGDPSRNVRPLRFGSLMKYNEKVSPYLFYQNTVLGAPELEPHAGILTFEALPATAPPPPPPPRRFFNNIFTVFFRTGEANYLGIAPTPTQAGFSASDGALAYQTKGNFWNRRGGRPFALMRCLTNNLPGVACPQSEFQTLELLKNHPAYHAIGWEEGSLEGDPGYQRIGADGTMRETDRLRLSASSAARHAGLPLPAGLLDPSAPSSGAPDIGAFQTEQAILGVGVDGALVF